MGRFKSRQKGVSAIQLLFYLVIGGFAVLCLLKVGPLYYENYKMNAIFERVGTLGIPIQNQTTNEIRSRLGRQFLVEGIKLNPSQIDIDRKHGHVTLLYDHEDRVNLFGNIDVIVTFENRFSTAEIDN